jgi:hypothetical protein
VCETDSGAGSGSASATKQRVCVCECACVRVCLVLLPCNMTVLQAACEALGLEGEDHLVGRRHKTATFVWWWGTCVVDAGGFLETPQCDWEGEPNS